MKKAYIKAIEVIKSCTNGAHIVGAYNYIHNFRILFGNKKTCRKLTKILMEKCAMRRKYLGNK